MCRVIASAPFPGEGAIGEWIPYRSAGQRQRHVHEPVARHVGVGLSEPHGRIVRSPLARAVVEDRRLPRGQFVGQLTRAIGGIVVHHQQIELGRLRHDALAGDAVQETIGLGRVQFAVDDEEDIGAGGLGYLGQSLRAQRCLLPARGWYEWNENETVRAASGRRRAACRSTGSAGTGGRQSWHMLVRREVSRVPVAFLPFQRQLVFDLR